MKQQRLVAGCAAIFLGMMSLTGCVSDDPTEPGDTDVPVTLGGGEASLASAVAMMDAEVAFESEYARYPTVTYVHEAALPDGEKWEKSAIMALGAVESPEPPETVGIDYPAATFTIGAEPMGPKTQVTLIAGGQDAERIRSSAHEQGYEGDDELIAPSDTDAQVQRWASKIRPLGDSAMTGGPDANFDLIDPERKHDESLLDRWNTAEVVECLGDVPVAQLSQWQNSEAESVLGVSATDSGSGTLVTVCVAGDEALGDEIATTLTEGPAEEIPSHYDSAEVEVTGDLVRVTLKLKPMFMPAGAVHSVPMHLQAIE